MIARVWHGYTKPEDADAYEAMLKPELLPGISKVPGYVASYLLRRPCGSEIEFITIMLWESLQAIQKFAGDNFQHSIVPAERRRYLVRHDAEATHFAVASLHRKS